MPVQKNMVSGIFDIVKTSSASSRTDAIKRMETVAFLLDGAFEIPGTRQRIGIDALIGLIPGLGDVITTILSTYVIWEAKNLGISPWAIRRMSANLAIHAVIGAIPLLGDAFDAFFRVNRRNMRIVRAELAKSSDR